MAVIVNISDGLGNQMFQYATGKSLALQNKTELFLDIWGYQTRKYRKYELDLFNITAPILPRWRSRFDFQIQRKRYTPLRRALQVVGSSYAPHFMLDPEQGFEQRITQLGKHVHLAGYWQSELYFRDIRDVLVKELSFRVPPDPANAAMLSEMNAAPNPVCVHFRRGDYVTTTWGQTVNGVCDLDYYHRALAYLTERIDNPSFYVFSDDPAWVDSILPELRAANPAVRSIKAVSHNVGQSDYEDLRLMMNCHHFVIANSSFSWWAAWLGQAPEKIVIAPKRWFLSATEESERDRVPQSWVRL